MRERSWRGGRGGGGEGIEGGSSRLLQLVKHPCSHMLTPMSLGLPSQLAQSSLHPRCHQTLAPMRRVVVGVGGVWGERGVWWMEGLSKPLGRGGQEGGVGEKGMAEEEDRARHHPSNDSHEGLHRLDGEV